MALNFGFSMTFYSREFAGNRSKVVIFSNSLIINKNIPKTKLCITNDCE